MKCKACGELITLGFMCDRATATTAIGVYCIICFEVFHCEEHEEDCLTIVTDNSL